MTALVDRGPALPATASLRGRVVLVTGGGGGLGRAISLTLASAGATVVAADLRLAAAEAVATEAREQALAVEGAALDLANAGGIELAFEEILARHGRIDVLVNNAGVDLTVPVTEMPVAEWDRIVAVNLRAPFVASRLAFREMAARGGGQIVNIVSTAARRAWANAAAYHASKWGLLGLSHALHVEGRPLGIGVTAVIAGGMKTPFLLDRFPEIDTSTLQDPAAVAHTVAFVLQQPAGTVIPEIMVLPVGETSWP